MKRPFIVTFAGAPGSSKSIVAQHLSMRFDLPVLSRDTIRSEVKEDLLTESINDPMALAEFERRYADRFNAALSAGKPFILDGSVDRSWGETKPKLEAAGYEWFIIDMELSRQFFTQLFGATRRPKSIEQLDAYLPQHDAFMERYGDEVNLRIDDDGFGRRLELAATALEEFLTKR